MSTSVRQSIHYCGTSAKKNNERNGHICFLVGGLSAAMPPITSGQSILPDSCGDESQGACLPIDNIQPCRAPRHARHARSQNSESGAWVLATVRCDRRIRWPTRSAFPRGSSHSHSWTYPSHEPLFLARHTRPIVRSNTNANTGKWTRNAPRLGPTRRWKAMIRRIGKESMKSCVVKVQSVGDSLRTRRLWSTVFDR